MACLYLVRPMPCEIVRTLCWTNPPPPPPSATRIPHHCPFPPAPPPHMPPDPCPTHPPLLLGHGGICIYQKAYLNISLPGSPSEVALSLQLSKLSCIIGICNNTTATHGQVCRAGPSGKLHEAQHKASTCLITSVHVASHTAVALRLRRLSNPPSFKRMSPRPSEANVLHHMRTSISALLSIKHSRCRTGHWDQDSMLLLCALLHRQTSTSISIEVTSHQLGSAKDINKVH